MHLGYSRDGLISPIASGTLPETAHTVSPFV
jgi:hypothetical protein